MACRPSILPLLFSVLFAATATGCASAEEDDAEGSNQAATATICTPFLMDVSVNDSGVTFERMCTATGEAEWALVRNLVIDKKPIRARFASKGENKVKTDRAIENMATGGVTRATTEFFRTTLDPAIGELVAAKDDAAKEALRTKIRAAYEEHLLTLLP